MEAAVDKTKVSAMESETKSEPTLASDQKTATTSSPNTGIPITTGGLKALAQAGQIKDSDLDPEILQVVSAFQKAMTQSELRKANEAKERLLSSGRSADDKEVKEAIKSAYLKFLFVGIEMNIAKKHVFNDPMPNQVREDLFIGSVGGAFNKKGLQQLGITHVISCLDFQFIPFAPELEYLQVPITDSAKSEIELYFEKALGFYRKCAQVKGKLLVHCFAGISRSSTILASIMMQEFGMTMDEALTTIKQNRDKINPNAGFREKLRILQNDMKLKKAKEERLKRERDTEAET